jgi:release factor glutamine methyltransferase
LPRRSTWPPAPENDPLTNASSIFARATTQFAASSDLRDSAARDALTLLLHTLGIARAQFHADPNRTLTPEQQTAYEAAIARRLNNEPIQYITGEQEFYGFALRVTPAVLIPRPETEHLVESVLIELKSLPAPPSPIRILDVGTGSGAIAIALARHLPHAQITATDISPAALAIAKQNAARHHARIDFLESDLLDRLIEERDTQEAALTREARRERYEVLVTNPPYIPDSDRATLHPQVRDHEPSTALFAGADGLAIYRRLIPQARAALAPNGLFALEIGHGQRDAVAALLSGWNGVRFIGDLQSIPRVALARRP